MLVKDLIDFLKRYPDQEALVLLASDEEGNSFSKLSHGFGTATLESEKELLDATGSLYGLDKEDMKKDWLMLYPEM